MHLARSRKRRRSEACGRGLGAMTVAGTVLCMGLAHSGHPFVGGERLTAEIKKAASSEGAA